MKGIIIDLAKIISDKESTITDLKHDMMQITKDKNKEIEGAVDHLVEKEIEYNDIINKLDNDLLIKTKQLENTEASFNLTFTDKDKQIRKLKTKLGAKMKNIDQLTKNVDELEERVLEAHYSEKIFEEIRNLMLTKGFINDKELDKLIKEIKKQSFMIFH
jgi:predicted RNase H-like nuclease (RuvC/YqgF family)